MYTADALVIRLRNRTHTLRVFRSDAHKTSKRYGDEHLVLNIDLTPTMLDFAGAPAPEPTGGRHSPHG